MRGMHDRPHILRRSLLLGGLALSLTPTLGSASDGPPPADAGIVWPRSMDAAPGVMLTALPNEPRWQLCDFAAHAIAAQPTPFEYDPVFRMVTPEQAEQVATAASKVLDATAEARPAAAAALRAMIDANPALARVGLTLPNLAARAAVADAAHGVAPDNPRLTAFPAESARARDEALAIATVRLVFASRCDAPVLYGFDGLEHPALRVRVATVDALVAMNRESDDAHGMERALERLAQKEEGDAGQRVRILRAAATLGIHVAVAAVKAAEKDKDAWVRAEALVTRATIRGELVGDGLKKASSAKDPVLRAGAVRAALTLADDGSLALVRAALKDEASVTDPVTGVTVRIADLARKGLQALGEPVES